MGLQGIALAALFVFVVALFLISPSLAKPTPLTSPAQVATTTQTLNSTLTATSNTILSSTTSSTETSTSTSYTTITSTAFSYPSGGGGIPGFPVEGILVGFALGAIVLGLLRRRSQQSVKH